MGLNKNGKPKRFSRGWKVAWWGSVEKKEDSHFFGLSGSLHKLDHISRTLREDWTTEDGLGRRTRWLDCQHTGRHEHLDENPCWCHQQLDEEDWNKYRALGDPSSDAEGNAARTTNLDFSSTVRKEEAFPKNEERGEFEQVEFMKQSRVPDGDESLGEVNRRQNGSVWRLFLLEAVPDWLRRSKNLVKRQSTRAKAGLASGEEMIQFEVKS